VEVALMKALAESALMEIEIQEGLASHCFRKSSG